MEVFPADTTTKLAIYALNPEGNTFDTTPFYILVF
jgi:hypothetical protein